jgi:hypothetical protein
MEAMLTGVPVVSIGPRAFGPGWVGDVFEGHEITGHWSDTPSDAKAYILERWLTNESDASVVGAQMRQRAIDLFDVAKVGKQWDEFLCAS